MHRGGGGTTLTFDAASGTGPRRRRLGPTSLRVLMGRVGAELFRLSRHAEDLQEALSEAGPGRGGARAASAMRRLQQVDRLTQTLAELGGLLSHPALTDRLDDRADLSALLETLRLGDLAAVLGGSEADNPPDPDGEVYWL